MFFFKKNLLEMVWIRALERRAAARLAVRDKVRRAGRIFKFEPIIKFRPDDRFGLVGGRMRHWWKKASEALMWRNSSIKLERDVKIRGCAEDRALLARIKKKRQESGMAEIDRSVSRVRKAFREANMKRMHESGMAEIDRSVSRVRKAFREANMKRMHE